MFIIARIGLNAKILPQSSFRNLLQQLTVCSFNFRVCGNQLGFLRISQQVLWDFQKSRIYVVWEKFLWESSDSLFIGLVEISVAFVGRVSASQMPRCNIVTGCNLAHGCNGRCLLCLARRRARCLCSTGHEEVDQSHG
ncbi:hypothetical protein PsorP6_016241 [Peronosclerospora sorghi]|uniref:Uncharacterized protein n=1 Tax=Peronosclerospora sorghi TaxID=230839 RepID=A0ACC0VQM2_9STRA|nr:hypothetical protein PsorP6_016241 [Peronosclerospora sorghi]